MWATMTRVLIADDDTVVRDVVRRYLERDGLDVLVARDGNEALRLLDSERIDVAVLDVMMPGRSGLTLCHTLRERSGYAVPVILLTALGEEADRIAGLEAGADDYLTKPFSPRELLARIRAVLRRRRPEVQQGRPDGIRAYRFDGWELNLNTRRLKHRDGSAVPLSNGEFSLLVVFLGSPNRVLSRDQLLDLSRLHSDDVYNRSVNTQILRLRRKLAAEPGQASYIRTERGAGYVFSVPVEIIY
jgi:DNA-binding response OmpR family regulator